MAAIKTALLILKSISSRGLAPHHRCDTVLRCMQMDERTLQINAAQSGG